MVALFRNALGVVLILVKLVSRNTTWSALQNQAGEVIRTDWLKFPVSGLHGTSYDNKGSSKIRDLFVNKDNILNADLRTSKSPTLELAFGDTGDKTFLDKNTIKHSISDMAMLTKAERLLGDKIKSCNAIQDGPKLYFPICPGDVVVVTIAGSMKMTCHEIERRIFYGPVTIKSLNCQQSLVFDAECGRKESLRINSTDCSDYEYKIALIAMTVLFILSVIILYGLISWYFGMERGVLVGGKKLKLKKNGKYYEVTYNTFINGEGSLEISFGSDPAIVNVEPKTYRKHWMKLLLLFLIFRPIHVDGYELIETYDSTILKYNYKILMSDSEVINFGSGSIKREVVVHTSNLESLFSTSSWELNIKEEYFCQWYKCEAISICGMGMLPFIKTGPLANQLFGYSNNSKSFYTCQKLQAYCVFGNGCKIISFEVVPSTKNSFSVFSMTTGGSHGGRIAPPTGCVVDSIEDKSAGILSNYLLLTSNTGMDYICHDSVFSRKPEMGMLGDLQITQDGEIHFATNDVTCVADHGDKAICRYGEPFITKINTLCEEVSRLPFQLQVDVANRLISWKKSGDAIVSIKCDRKLPIKTANSKCINIKIRVWEIAHLDSQLLLSFIAESSEPGSIFSFPPMVHMSSHVFTCNGKHQLSELYDLKSLATVGINYTIDTIPYNSLDDLQGDHFSDSDPENYRGITIFDKVINSPPFWGLSGTTILILVIAALMILRK